MSKEFEIAREFEVEAPPEKVWEAITSGTGGWLWPMEYEPKEGGTGPYGATITAWDPPHRLTSRVEDVDGIDVQTLNQLDHTIESRDGGRSSWVRYVHSGIFVCRCPVRRARWRWPSGPWPAAPARGCTGHWPHP
ncbi:hypothetical protein ABZS63_16240, partial [Streptomyces sp. NPDC005568]